ncbi:hypothetical protein OF83DRAFT_422374 [Amylostereum chailletii]|nr:hypothetical protein OF83DRAFT_422374 [Amylostereum chailletii]
MMTASSCFYFPLRYGAFTVSLAQFICSGILAVALWFEVSTWSLDVGERITGTSAAAATYYTVLAISALLGSIAVAYRHKGTLKYYALCLGWSLGIQLVISALQLWGYLSTNRDELITQCEAFPNMDRKSCMTAFQLSVGWLIASVVIGLLLQLCAFPVFFCTLSGSLLCTEASAYIVSSYSSKLSAEDAWTENAPLPGVNTNMPPATFAGLGNYNAWAASSRDSISSDDSEAMFDAAPPARVPRHKRHNRRVPPPSDAQSASGDEPKNPFDDPQTKTNADAEKRMDAVRPHHLHTASDSEKAGDAHLGQASDFKPTDIQESKRASKPSPDPIITDPKNPFVEVPLATSV